MHSSAHLDPAGFPEHGRDLLATHANREEEEAYAKEHSRATRILGWLTIVGSVLDMVGNFFQGRIDLGMVAWLIAGILIKDGKQSALRFVVFGCTLAAILGLVHLTSLVAMDQPLELNSKWLDFRDFEFWSGFVCPIAYACGLGVLAFAVLRSRLLAFWTRTVKTWAWIVGIGLLVKAGVLSWDLQLNHRLARERAADLAAVRSYFWTYGTTGSSSAVRAAEDLATRPGIKSIRLYSEPHTSRRLPEKNLPPDPKPKTRTFEEFIRQPSGEWGKIEIEFLLPKNP